MNKFILILLFFFYLSFNINVVPTNAQTLTLKKGIYNIERLNLQSDTMYTAQNNSFSERTFMLVFDSNCNIIQALRITPQSGKYKLPPLKAGYKILVVGEGQLTIS